MDTRRGDVRREASQIGMTPLHMAAREQHSEWPGQSRHQQSGRGEREAQGNPPWRGDRSGGSWSFWGQKPPSSSGCGSESSAALIYRVGVGGFHPNFHQLPSQTGSQKEMGVGGSKPKPSKTISFATLIESSTVRSPSSAALQVAASPATAPRLRHRCCGPTGAKCLAPGSRAGARGDGASVAGGWSTEGA